MTCATIMVHIDPECASPARLRLAHGLAERLGARLIGVAARGIAPIVAWPGVEIAHQGGQNEYRELQDLLARAQAQFQAAAQGLRQPSEWRARVGMPTDFMIRESRAADLLVVGQHEMVQDIYHRLDIGELVLSAGRPTLVVPEAVDALTAKSIVVAWKDTREARRAVHDALPLLAAAERVLIAEVSGPGQESGTLARLETLAGHLVRHRVPLPLCKALPEQDDVADTLFDAARDLGADLIVAGAYGRSRVGEWIFGGVSTALLNRSPVCCLLSH